MYKTIVLRFLEDRPELHDRLRKNRQLLQAVNRLAEQLKASHEVWKDFLSQTNPAESEYQTASEALELAIKELADNLSSGAQPDGGQSLSLDEAMAFVRSHLPPK